MAIYKTSLILPCQGWDDFPTHLDDDSSAEILAGWTSLWHPSLIAATKGVPGALAATNLPGPEEMADHLVVAPKASRQIMPSDWCDRVREVGPAGPWPVEPTTSRASTLVATLAAASVAHLPLDVETTADFFALGFAYLQVELLTKAMRYTSVLDTAQFEAAVVAAAKEAVAGRNQPAHEELARAFDLLADTRNHAYAVDYYAIDLALLADATLGEALRTRLAGSGPTNLLITGQQLERLAQQPETLAALRAALDAGTVSLVGGKYRHEPFSHVGPEGLLADLRGGQEVAQRLLGHKYEVYGQFDSAFTILLPAVLRGLGYRGALHAAFDGGKLPRPEQRKTNWGADTDASIETLAVMPLDAARPSVWLLLAERVADTIARDHVATILLASWPGAEAESFGDLRRAAKFNNVLGKLVTLEEYFEITREVDDWIHFRPSEYPNRTIGSTSCPADSVSSQVEGYRSDARGVYRRVAAGLSALAGFSVQDGNGCATNDRPEPCVVMNPWNFSQSYLIGMNPLARGGDFALSAELDAPSRTANLQVTHVQEVPGCGFRKVPREVTAPAAVGAAQSARLAEGLTLRNEHLEVSISPKSGGIQSIRTHRDRGTRVSQRLVFRSGVVAEDGESQMVAERVEITRNDSSMGEITSRGNVLDAKGELHSHFVQRVRVIRGLAPIVVEVELEPRRLPEGAIWDSYFASRLAWRDDAFAVRRGLEWTACQAAHERIESVEWVEIDDALGRITCLALGLPFHRRVASNRLDSLLLVEGESVRRFQFGLGLNLKYPTQTALELLFAGEPCFAEMRTRCTEAAGWLVHVGARNVLITHLEPLAKEGSGVRVRLRETEGVDTQTVLTAFRPFRSARITDFRGERLEVLSVVEGSAQVDLGPGRWIQVEAEW
ncbi:MAG: hypothetical protein IT425_13685 [Pirellulales bacterium]|nr:hypothetical protein [Pirellulales bacterium]